MVPIRTQPLNVNASHKVLRSGSRRQWRSGRNAFIDSWTGSRIGVDHDNDPASAGATAGVFPTQSPIDCHALGCRYLPLLLTAAGCCQRCLKQVRRPRGATLAPIGEPGRAIGLGRGDLALNGSPPEGRVVQRHTRWSCDQGGPGQSHPCRVTSGRVVVGGNGLDERLAGGLGACPRREGLGRG